MCRHCVRAPLLNGEDNSTVAAQLIIDVQQVFYKFRREKYLT